MTYKFTKSGEKVLEIANELAIELKRRYTRQTPQSIGKTLPLARYRRARQSDPI